MAPFLELGELREKIAMESKREREEKRERIKSQIIPASFIEPGRV